MDEFSKTLSYSEIPVHWRQSNGPALRRMNLGWNVNSDLWIEEAWTSKNHQWCQESELPGKLKIFHRIKGSNQKEKSISRISCRSLTRELCLHVQRAAAVWILLAPLSYLLIIIQLTPTSELFLTTKKRNNNSNFGELLHTTDQNMLSTWYT